LQLVLVLLWMKVLWTSERHIRGELGLYGARKQLERHFSVVDDSAYMPIHHHLHAGKYFHQ
jgi:hypothetical protein